MEVRKENRENKNKTHTIKRQEIKINERCKTNEEKKKLNGKATYYHKKEEKKSNECQTEKEREKENKIIAN